jgi:hypothetical protein
MSEPMGMHIDIGGVLPASLINELLEAINDEIGERVGGPDTEAELRETLSTMETPDTIRWDGLSNYGMCDDVTAFCRKHGLSYIHHSEANGEYDAYTYYWVPGMDGQEAIQSDSGGNCMVDADKVRPLADFLLALARDGEKALPLFLNTDHDELKKLVTKGLKNYKRMLNDLPKVINRLLPVTPELPPLTIKEDA